MAAREGYFGTQSRAGATESGARTGRTSRPRGQGKFVGISASMRGPATRAFLEGDERVYTDGSHSPQIHGTGTEDFYQSGWYFNRDTYTEPFNGDPAHLGAATGCAAGSDCTGAYRLMIGDAVPFGSSITFGIEHGPGDDVAANYSTTAFWYGSGKDAPSRTDTLKVGDAASEAAHGYTSDDPGPVTTLTSTYEGVDGTQQQMTAPTRATTAAVTFKLAVDPANKGVTLLRTGDQNTAYQQARVASTGRRWRTGSSRSATDAPLARRRYALPATATAGKESITVTLTPVSGGPAWSAASYSAWSAA